MKNYSSEQKAIFGEKFADIFGVKWDKKTGYYKTSWGNKSAIGIYEMFCRISESIQNGWEDDL